MSYLEVQRLRQIQDEFGAVNAAVSYVEQEWPKVHLQSGFDLDIRLKQVTLARSRLEDTYIICAFAQFEGILRDYLRSQRPAVRIPRTAEYLINRTASRYHVQDTCRDDVHTIREYRNSVVHENGRVAVSVSFDQALTKLSTFLSFLP